MSKGLFSPITSASEVRPSLDPKSYHRPQPRIEPAITPSSNNDAPRYIKRKAAVVNQTRGDSNCQNIQYLDQKNTAITTSRGHTPRVREPTASHNKSHFISSTPFQIFRSFPTRLSFTYRNSPSARNKGGATNCPSSPGVCVCLSSLFPSQVPPKPLAPPPFLNRAILLISSGKKRRGTHSRNNNVYRFYHKCFKIYMTSNFGSLTRPQNNSEFTSSQFDIDTIQRQRSHRSFHRARTRTVVTECIHEGGSNISVFVS